MSEDTRDEYDRFKAEYPNVYSRLLEINRALSALQRAVTTLSSNAHMDPVSRQEAQQDATSFFLELE